MGKRKSNMGKKLKHVGEKHRLPSGTMVLVQRVESIRNPNDQWEESMSGRPYPKLYGIHSDDLRVFRDDLTASIKGRMKDCPTMTWEEKKTVATTPGADGNPKETTFSDRPLVPNLEWWVQLSSSGGFSVSGERLKDVEHHYLVNIQMASTSWKDVMMENRFVLDVLKTLVDGEAFDPGMDVAERRRMLYLMEESMEENPAYYRHLMLAIRDYDPIDRAICEVEVSVQRDLDAMRKEALRKKRSKKEVEDAMVNGYVSAN